MGDAKEVELSVPGDAITSVSFNPIDSDLLLSTAWDSTVKVHSVSDPQNPRATFLPTRRPIFDASWSGKRGPSGKIYSGGLDKRVVETDLSTSDSRIIATHDDAVKCVKWSDEVNALITAGWDGSVRCHDLRSSATTTPINLKLPNKVFSLDTTADKLVIAMAQRQVSIYDLRMLEKNIDSRGGAAIDPLKNKESTLKFMTRSVRCMPNGNGFAASSIEGRVSVESFADDSASQAKNFAFKCHRAVVDGIDTIYPVNALAFHPIHGTFATGGGDSMVSIWDPTAKKRLRQLPKFPASISSLSFSPDGSKLAIACAVVEEEGPVAPGARNALVIRNIGDECKPKVKA